MKTVNEVPDERRLVVTLCLSAVYLKKRSERNEEKQKTAAILKLNKRVRSPRGKKILKR